MKLQATVEERLALIESNRLAGHEECSSCQCDQGGGNAYTTPSPVNDSLLEEVVEGAFQAIASLTEVAQCGSNKEKIAASEGIHNLLVSLTTYRD